MFVLNFFNTISETVFLYPSKKEKRTKRPAKKVLLFINTVSAIIKIML